MRIDAAVRFLAVGLVVAFGLLAEARAAEPRVALVIGNGAYRSVPELDNSRNDADDISVQLKRVGFAVIDGRDLDRSAMFAALGRFAQRVRGTDAGLVYYSGHGMQINGQNYLVPVDLKLASSFTPFDLIKLDDVIEALNYTAGVKILVLDACRDNPFANSLAENKSGRGIGATRGLAKIERSQGMLIAYSTQSNSVAADGFGRNSPFTAALVREIQVPGLEVAAMFRRVLINVNRETQGAQTPELSVSLLQDFYLNPQESDIDAWKKLGPSAGAADLKRFISKFPDSVLLDAVRARLDAIENASERERLAREYADKELRLRRDLEAAEAGYKKAMSELSQRRDRDEREKLADTKASQIPVPAAATKPALAGFGSGNVPAAAGPSRADIEREQASKELAAKEQLAREQAAKEQAAKAEQERLASQVAAYEADKARLAEERQTLERVMTERLARAQAERERAEKRVATETARLPVYALEQSRTTVPAATAAPTPRRRGPASCQEINARAQLGDLSESDRDVLRQCR
jgi:Caspase domain